MVAGVSRRSRASGGKLRMDHAVLKGWRRTLEEMCELPEVSSVIPGRIDGHRVSGGDRLEYRRRTDAGVELRLVAEGTFQEVFVNARGTIEGLERALGRYFA